MHTMSELSESLNSIDDWVTDPHSDVCLFELSNG